MAAFAASIQKKTTGTCVVRIPRALPLKSKWRAAGCLFVAWRLPFGSHTQWREIEDVPASALRIPTFAMRTKCYGPTTTTPKPTAKLGLIISRIKPGTSQW